MKALKTNIEGVIVLEPKVLEDFRGVFVKTYHEEVFDELGLSIDWKEEYFTTSNKGVVRGMHFQIPPHEHDKLVSCTSGRVLDVVLDLRKSSPTYLNVFSVELSERNCQIVFIPKGCAHGFMSLEDQSTMFYKVSSVYHPECDMGIMWSSIGFEWPFADEYLVSERDQKHMMLNEFDSPF